MKMGYREGRLPEGSPVGGDAKNRKGEWSGGALATKATSGLQRRSGIVRRPAAPDSAPWLTYAEGDENLMRGGPIRAVATRGRGDDRTNGNEPERTDEPRRQAADREPATTARQALKRSRIDSRSPLKSPRRTNTHRPAASRTVISCQRMRVQPKPTGLRRFRLMPMSDGQSHERARHGSQE